MSNLLPVAYDTPLGKGFDCPLVKDFAVDTAKASATGVFAAASKDRGGDLLEIAGIKTANHRKNPIVLWLHGYDYKQQESQIPIGVTEDQEGQYTVKLLPADGVALATTYFTQKSLLGSQICALVMEGTIRGQSIGYRELKVERMFEDDRYVGTKLVEVEMIETSWVPIPMNQDAVRAALGRDWAGKSLVPAIKQVLAPLAGTMPVWANGVTFEVKTMATEAPSPTANVKVKAEMEEEKPDGEEEDVEEKHGAKAMRKCYKALTTCAKRYGKEMGPLDDGPVKDLLNGHAEGMSGMIEEHKSAFAENYPDSDPLEDKEEGDDTKDDANDGGDVDEDEKALLARLRKAELALKHQLRLQNQSA